MLSLSVFIRYASSYFSELYAFLHSSCLMVWMKRRLCCLRKSLRAKCYKTFWSGQRGNSIMFFSVLNWHCEQNIGSLHTRRHIGHANSCQNILSISIHVCILVPHLRILPRCSLDFHPSYLAALASHLPCILFWEKRSGVSTTLLRQPNAIPGALCATEYSSMSEWWGISSIERGLVSLSRPIMLSGIICKR